MAFPGDPDKMYVPGTTKALTDAAAEAPYTIPKVLAAAGWTKEDLDYIVPTQVAKWIGGAHQQGHGYGLEQVRGDRQGLRQHGLQQRALGGLPCLQDGRLHAGSKILMVGGAVGANIGMMTAVL